MTKTQFLHIRMSKADKARVAEAAARNHLDSSTWARMVILQAVEASEEAKSTERRGE